MRKLIIGLTIGVVIALPLTVLQADEAAHYSFSEALKSIKEHKTSHQKTVTDPELSSTTQQFQATYSNRMQRIQTMSTEYQDLQSKLSTEIGAYQSLYSYWMVNENLNISRENMLLAKQELKIVELKYEKGIVSEMDVERTRMSYNNAVATYEDAKLNENMTRYQLNLDMNQDMLESFTLSIPEFKQFIVVDYDPEKTKEKVLKDHKGLEMQRSILSIYKRTAKDAEKDISKIQDQIDSLEEIIAIKEANGEDATNEKNLLQELYLSTRGKDQAQDELTEYYTEKSEETRIDIAVMEESLELLAHRYAETFEQLSRKIEMFEENVAMAESIYEKTNKMFDNGLITVQELEQARIAIQQAKLQLISTQNEYMMLKEEFHLFTEESYMPTTSG